MKDGVDHINVYSQGNTELGRLLSNFAHTPFRIPLLGEFESVEGLWYWYLTGEEKCRHLIGYKAKEFGQKQTLLYPEIEFPPRLLKIVYKAKLKYNPHIKEMLLKNTLPFKHYYVYNDKIVTPKQWQWTATLWQEIKNEQTEQKTY